MYIYVAYMFACGRFTRMRTLTRVSRERMISLCQLSKHMYIAHECYLHGRIDARERVSSTRQIKRAQRTTNENKSDENE